MKFDIQRGFNVGARRAAQGARNKEKKREDGILGMGDGERLEIEGERENRRQVWKPKD
jgi:hypothetical protein